MSDSRHKKLLGILTSLVILVLACNFGQTGEPTATPEDPVQLAVLTLSAQMTTDAAGQPLDGGDAIAEQDGDDDAVTEGGAPSATPGPTALPTEPPPNTISVPMVAVSKNTNCRTGNSIYYELIGALLIGETAQAVGRSADSQYWIIENPDRQGTCWLWGYYATITGDYASLPIMTPPPPPPTYTPTYTYTPTPTYTPTETPGFTPTDTPTQEPTYTPSPTFTMSP